jgi:hypothetical protein
MGSGKIGSRNSDGNVPNVNWNPENRKLYVNWTNRDNRDANLRSRSEVFAPSPPLWRVLRVFEPASRHFRNFL